MKVLITGGCGFIGTNFIQLALQERPNWEIVNLDKLTYAAGQFNLTHLEGERYRLEQGDICDYEVVEKHMAGAKLVIHFAAESHVDRSILDPSPFIETNVKGTNNLLQAAHRAGIDRFLHISTDEVYGDVKAPRRSKEIDAFRPSSPYAASKAGADHLATSYYRTYRFPVVIARSSNNFGPYQFPEKVIPLWISNILARRAIPMYGDGEQIRDWIYVEDNARALLQIVEAGKDGEAYNVGVGKGTSNKKLAELLRSIIGAPENINTVPDRPGHDRRYALNTNKIKRLKWKPRYTLREGLKKTIDWYRANGDWLVDRRKYSATIEQVRERQARGEQL